MKEAKYIKQPCDICGSKIAMYDSKNNAPSGNVIHMFPVDENKEKMEQLIDIKRLICDDCWNVLIDLLKPDEEADND